ncbi:hypothetical protein SLNSH_14940 [Alsobacter soli]|uniref:Uncharacterized protein n=1 Tax=Alsobacter soli TaxID=2109933 RepID=A0A2T1HRL7_9HYPH|nr:hypothetical protein SLNSH_14940 [Alsobacter soli]
MPGVALAVAFWMLTAPAAACDLNGMAGALADADEHQFWVEFWEDSDPAESAREIGYSIASLRKTLRMSEVDDCDNRRRAAALGDSAFRSLQRLNRVQTTLQASLGGSP